MESIVTVVRFLMAGVVFFALIGIASFVGTTLALRSYHEDEQPSMSVVVAVLRGLG
ncbi:hypothetical protein [Natrarchaeobaculum sulfurireducens]|uniref:hypothetical protein n=1 Tax=Natrarchaeobaculum sulfurireducens TaxID=2044521 RepID=UPI0012B51C38|nr:hypothetical protein [Natrarchaeobaculum sulfurireducens]